MDHCIFENCIVGTLFSKCEENFENTNIRFRKDKLSPNETLITFYENVDKIYLGFKIVQKPMDEEHYSYLQFIIGEDTRNGDFSSPILRIKYNTTIITKLKQNNIAIINRYAQLNRDLEFEGITDRTKITLTCNTMPRRCADLMDNIKLKKWEKNNLIEYRENTETDETNISTKKYIISDFAVPPLTEYKTYYFAFDDRFNNNKQDIIIQ